MAEKLILSVVLTAILCQLSEQKPTASPLLSKIYADCDSGMTSRCFAMPDGCIKTLNCSVLLSATPSDTGADFQLFWVRGADKSSGWVGAALSADQKMGNDSVTECVLDKNNKVIVRQGLTYGGDSFGVKTVEPVRGITKETGNITDNILYCSWSRVDDTMVKTLDFNILNNKYYVFLANGPVDDKGQLKHHTNQSVSKDAYYLAKNISTPNATTTTGTPASTSPTSSTPKPTSTTTSGTSAKPTVSSTPKPSSTPKSSSTPKPSSTANPSSTPKPASTTNISTQTSNTTSTGNSTGTPSRTTQHSKTTKKPTSKPNGSTTITFSLSLALFIAIVFSLNLQ